jgi:hypothetical protein
MVFRVRRGTVSGDMTAASLLGSQRCAPVIVSKTRTLHDDPMEPAERLQNRLAWCNRGENFRAEDQRVDWVMTARLNDGLRPG